LTDRRSRDRTAGRSVARQALTKANLFGLIPPPGYRRSIAQASVPALIHSDWSLLNFGPALLLTAREPSRA